MAMTSLHVTAGQLDAGVQPDESLARGAEDSRDAHAEAIDRERVRLVCEQWVRSPYFATVTSAYIIYLLWDSQPQRWLLIAWAATVVGLLFLRLPFCYWVLRKGDALTDVGRWIRVMEAFSLANGIAGGASGWLFFEGNGLTNDAFLTMILGCWSAAAISTAGALPRTFYAFMVPFLLPVTVRWFQVGGDIGIPLGSLLVLFCLLEISFARESGKSVLKSVRLRFENVDLVRRLDASRREAELQRERAEAANLAKSRFIAAASHDLRNPLHAIGIYARLLQTVSREPKARELASDIGISVQALDGLFEALLDISKLDAGVVEPKLELVRVDDLLVPVIRESMSRAGAKGIVFDFRSSGETLLTDAVLFERIVRNLVGNAIRYTQSGRVEVAVQGCAGFVELAVADSGPGIPEAERTKVFQEFYQVPRAPGESPQGFGLGLAIVQRSAQLLGAVVKVGVSAHGGALLTVSFPGRLDEAPQAPVDEVSNPAPAPETGLEGLRVLVVDDEAQVRDAMRKLLSAWGCDPVVAAGLREALEALDQPQPPRVVISDLRLAGGESGLDAIAAVRERVPGVGVLLVTGDVAADRLQDARASGVLMLHKPVDPERLLEAIRIVAGVRPMGR